MLFVLAKKIRFSIAHTHTEQVSKILKAFGYFTCPSLPSFCCFVRKKRSYLRKSLFRSPFFLNILPNPSLADLANGEKAISFYARESILEQSHRKGFLLLAVWIFRCNFFF